MRILDCAPVDHSWWKRISTGAKSGQPHYETLLDLHLHDFAQQLADDQGVDDGEARVTPLPKFSADLDGVNDEEFPISQDEGLAILSRFLIAERGELAKGAELFTLQWLVLCAIHCPQRERFSVLREFTNIGYLREKETGVEYHGSGLEWPLVVLPPCIEAIEGLLYVRKYVPDLYSVSRRSALVIQSVPFLRSIANFGARQLLPRV